jgi:citrate lyase beta subunit
MAWDFYVPSAEEIEWAARILRAAGAIMMHLGGILILLF